MISFTTSIPVEISAKDIVDNLKPEDVINLLNQVSLKFDSEFVTRRDCARSFADGACENSIRFLSEVIAAYHTKRSDFVKQRQQS